MVNLPGHGWKDLKRELMSKWHGLSENDIDSTGGHRASLAELLERKVGLKIEEASEHIEEMAERFQLFDEPKVDTQPQINKEKIERVYELSPEKAEKPKIKIDEVQPKDLD